jgi:hypothetical protein
VTLNYLRHRYSTIVPEQLEPTLLQALYNIVEGERATAMLKRLL